ncbi:MAG: hypothetical protein EPO08_03415 [Rhodospirillaceae bacterium]|nr:MAG: hypothetical protein EPO08_03415 [Rhodospirillaceae bacterium]
MAGIAFRAVFGWVLLAAALATPVHASDIRVGIGALPADPGNPFNGFPTSDVRAALFDGLTRFDKDGKLAPALATTWTNDTPTTWRFVLRRNVVFSNGEPFTAAAVVATVAWLQTADGQLTPAGNALKGVIAEEEDDHVVILHSAYPDSILPRRLAQVMIVAPQAWGEMGPEAFAKTPATTGPFRAGDLRTSGKITLVANWDSWRKPMADRLILTAMPERLARVKALLAGQIDVAAHIGVEDIETLDKANLLTSVTPAMAVMAIAFRQAGGGESPLHDVRVRRALNYAIDKAALNQQLLRGLGAAVGQPAARDVDGFNPDVTPYPYDPEKAKALLAEAGYGSGLKLRIAIAADRYPGDRALYQSLVEALAKVGVTLEVDTVADEDWAKSVASGVWTPEVDGFSLPFDAASTHDAITPLETYSCLKLVPFVCDQPLTARIVAAVTATGLEHRANLLADLARTFHDDPPALYLVDAFDLFGVGRKVEGFAVADRVPVYENIAPAPAARP